MMKRILKHAVIVLYIVFLVACLIWAVTVATVETVAASPSQSTECKNMLHPSNVTDEELRSALKYDLVDLSSAFIDAEEKFGVNAVYLAAISALESGWGRYQFKENNIFGFGQREFESEEECILYVAEFLSKHYLRPDGLYYGGGYELKHVNKAWNGREQWLTAVTDIADGIMNKIKQAREVNDVPKYTIKSTSNDGVYYLVNGWRKCKTFWFNEESVLGNIERTKMYFFNKPSQAKASLTRLLRIMPDYLTDTFEVVEL